ncbi:ATP/GTP-binding protein [Thomasclavelia sp.]|uniref:AAA family ATPase n=1 Tax=Thomasclavelia sp. TaxID=3025757 RepID=UPI0025FF4F70|nr:AAA family ATPase [Thomasclavelia sp.]
MLIQFSFKNFRSFKDDATIDLSATKITEFNNRVIEIGNEKLLPVAAIFGANASGKSNVQLAFRYMRAYVINSFGFGGDAKEKKNKSNFLKPTPFLFDNSSKNSESVFEVYFIEDESDKFKSYNYGFSIDALGVKEEWLNTRAKTARGDFKSLFYRNRDENELDLSGLPKKSQENILTALEKETLVVSLGAKLKVQALKKIRDWFLKHEIANFGDPLENFVLSRYIPDGFDEDKKVRQAVLNYFSSFDESIVDFEVEKVKDEDGDEHLNVKALHKVIGSNEMVALPLKEESAGTLKMLSLYPSFQEVMETGGVFFIDELNSRLHPLLVRNFLISFLDPKINKNHAQIIFTTHDSWTLANNLLRRDEIWFTEKDQDGISSLYSLADFSDEDGMKIRKDENYEKNYLLGKYGAIPELKTIILKEK